MSGLLKHIFLFLSSAFTLVAQPESRMQSITVNDGLSQNSVYAIFQDRTGYLWFGTADGLNKYDGYKFTVYQNDPADDSSILGSSIRVITEDNRGTIWVGSDKGLSGLDLATGKFDNYSWNITAGRARSAIAILDINVDSSGILWLSSVYWIKRFDPRTKEETNYKMFPTIPETGIEGYSAIVRDGGVFWTLNDSGLVCFDTTAKRFFIPPCAQNISHSVDAIQALSDHSLLLGGPRGDVYIVDTKAGRCVDHWVLSKKTIHKNVRISSACQDNNGNVFVGIYDQGVIARYAGSNAIKQFAAAGIVRALLHDHSDIVWVGTDGNGVKKMNMGGKEFSHFIHDPNNPNSLSGNFVKALEEENDGTIWVGTVPDGLNAYHPKSATWQHFTHSDSDSGSLVDNSICSLVFDSYGRLWVGTEIGIDIFDKRSGIFRHIPYKRTSINRMIRDRYGSIWIVSPYGLARADYDLEHVHFRQYSNDYSEYVSVLRDSQGRIWSGSINGFVSVIDSSGKKLEEFENISGAEVVNINNYVRCICETSGNIFWFATEFGMVRFDDNTKEKIVYTTRDGLPNNFLYGIVPDGKGNLWISSNKGISRFDMEKGIFHNYDVVDGLQSSEFNTGAYLRSDRGDILFGGVNGFNIYTPDNVRKNTHRPEVVFTDFSVGENRVSVDANIRNHLPVIIPFDRNSFSFESTALDYTNPQKNKYAHMLEGFDPKWIYTGTRRFIQYTNLDPGTYTLRIKASNNDGVWNEEGASLVLTVVPPFWKTGWFAFSSLTLVVLGIGGSVRFFEIRKIRRTIEKLEREKALERERSRISRDMHDEVGSNLTKIAILSELAKRVDAEDRAVQLDKISTSSREVIDNISHIIWAVDPKNDTLENTLAYIREYISETFEMIGTRLVVDFPDVVPATEIAAEFRRNIFLTVKEAVNNIVKYAQAEEVRISVVLDHKIVRWSIIDNGIGFDAGDVSRFGNGLHNMKRRIEEIGGTFSVSSQKESGTTIAFCIPITTFV